MDERKVRGGEGGCGQRGADGKNSSENGEMKGRQAVRNHSNEMK